MSEAPLSIIIIEDEPEFRRRFETIIQEEPSMRLVGSAGTKREGQALIERENFDVMLIDLGLPDGSGIDLIRQVSARRPDVDIMVDFHGRPASVNAAMDYIRVLAGHRILFAEEPVPPEDLVGLAEISARSPVPIASGEEECGRQSFRPLIDGRCLDVYQVDLSRNGFTDAAYLRQRVEEIGARLCNHCYTSPVTVAASLHWLSTCRDAFIFEDCVEDSPLRHALTHERVQAVDGWIEIPDRPGLGVTLDEDFVAAHLVSESR